MGLQKPTVGDSEDVWGGLINNDLDVIDQLAVSPPVAVAASGTSAPVVALITSELCTGGLIGITRTLPDAVAYNGRIFVYTKIDAGVGAITISSVQLINGAGSYTLVNQYQFVWVQAGGGTWSIIGSN